MDETYKYVAEQSHLQSGRPSEDVPLIGIFLISNIRKAYQVIPQYALASRML